MDRGQSSAYDGEGVQNNGHQNYSYNQSQNDPFNSFINTEDENAFDNSWHAADFSQHQQPNNHGYEQSAQHWQPQSYPASEQAYVQASRYSVDANYSGSDSIFHASAFDAQQPREFAGTPDLAHATYAPSTGLDPTALNNEVPYQFSHPPAKNEVNATISPAAITSYPNISEISFGANIPPPQNTDKISSSKAQDPRAGISPVTPVSIHGWRSLANRTVKSIDRPGLHIKPTNQFENTTQTKRFNGFIFVGSGSIVVECSKANTPRYKRKKSRNEALKLLQLEKGDSPWHADREPLVKKLKVAAKKQGGPKSMVAATAKGTSSANESSGSDSDDSSDYSSESEAEKEPEEKFPLSGSRPSETNKAIEYDLVKAIWAKRSTVLSGPVIRTALGEVWEILKGVRDQWKKKTTLQQSAADKKDQTTVKAFERRIADQRQLLENCNTLMLKHGHPSIIEKLCENPVMLVVFYQFLADRIKYSEYSGNFVNGVLELLSRCPSVDASLLEKTKIDKLLPRFQKRGDERAKRLTEKILENAKTGEKKSAMAHHTNGSQTADTDSKSAATKVARKDVTLSTKKSNEVPGARPTGTEAVAKPISSNGDSKASSKAKTDGSTEVKTKVVNVKAKPSGFFSSLKSASKKPGTSTKAEDGGSGPAKKAGNVATGPKPAFSFAATMAGLAKQKDEPVAKVEDIRKPETEQERAKRLRKESRRSLRVSFKADEDLVAIRTFVHDPEEEAGHDHSQVRDVGDSKGEGQMLKMHKDLELDDEEDYEPPEEITPEWTYPSAIDFGVIDADERARNCVSRGGLTEIDEGANERQLQKEREEGTLMAFYASKHDVPPTPREPQDHQSSDPPDEKLFGPPSSLTLTRLDEPRVQQPALQAAYQVANPSTPDLSALLSLINSTKQQPQAPAPNPLQAQNSTDPANPLAAILSKLPTTTQPPNPPAAPLQQAQPLPFNLQAALASIQQPSQQSYQAQPAFGAPPANPVPNLQTILSQIGAQAGAAPAPAAQPYGYAGAPSGFPMHEDRKRQLEDDGDQSRKRARGGKPFTGSPYLPCRFWQEGKCRKGDECTFLHENSG